MGSRHLMEWRDGVELLQARGWTAERMVRALLALVRAVPGVRGLSPRLTLALVPDVSDGCEAEALTAVARAWLSDEEPGVLARLEGLPRLEPRPDAGPEDAPRRRDPRSRDCG